MVIDARRQHGNTPYVLAAPTREISFYRHASYTQVGGCYSSYYYGLALALLLRGHVRRCSLVDLIPYSTLDVNIWLLLREDCRRLASRTYTAALISISMATRMLRRMFENCTIGYHDTSRYYDNYISPSDTSTSIAREDGYEETSRLAECHIVYTREAITCY